MTPQLPDHIDPAGTQTLQIIAKADHFTEWMYNTIRPFLKGEILEIGSGIGNISAFAIRDQLPLTISDINPEYQQFLRKKFSDKAKDILSINLQHSAFPEQYRSLKEKYDSIFLLNVIEHLADDHSAIENCLHMLRKNGNLIVLAPAYPWLYCRLDKELGHYRRYTVRSLSAVFSNPELSILHQQYFNCTGIAGWFVYGKLFRNKLIGSREMSVFNRIVPFFKLADRIIFKKAGLSVIVVARKK